MTYPYRLVGKIIDEPKLAIASIEDIACMKLAAITSRAANKDYIDLYFILQKEPLAKILKKLSKKLPQLDETLVLKSLIYFKDIVMEPIRFKIGLETDFDEIKHFLENEVKKIH